MGRCQVSLQGEGHGVRPAVPSKVCRAVLQLLKLSVVSTLQQSSCGAMPGAELVRALLGDPS